MTKQGLENALKYLKQITLSIAVKDSLAMHIEIDKAVQELEEELKKL